jgi:hypothetical protein
VNHDEMVDLLSLISARDNRSVGHATVLAWLEDVGDLAFEDARAAVARYYRESREWIMPADVRRLVKTIRSERIAAAPIPAPDAAMGEKGYRAALKQIIMRIGDGRVPFRAIEAGGGSEPNEEYRNARGKLGRGPS